MPIYRYPNVSGRDRKWPKQPDSKSLDRIDPTKGYVPGNIRVISSRANILLNNMTAEEAKLIYLSFL